MLCYLQYELSVKEVTVAYLQTVTIKSHIFFVELCLSISST